MTIVAVAIRTTTGEVFMALAPYRHADIMREGGDDGRGFSGHPELAGGRYGFLTDGGVFLDRQQALAHVQHVGQPLLCRTPHPLGLFSEDVW